MTEHDEAPIIALYQAMLDGWNKRSADNLAFLYDEAAHVTGFDGSQMNGRAEIGSTFAQIFADHQTAPYVGKVREVRFLAENVALLRAIAGMPKDGDINPAVNAIQTLIAQKQPAGDWKIVLFQTTPA